MTATVIAFPKPAEPAPAMRLPDSLLRDGWWIEARAAWREECRADERRRDHD